MQPPVSLASPGFAAIVPSSSLRGPPLGSGPPPLAPRVLTPDPLSLRERGDGIHPFVWRNMGSVSCYVTLTCAGGANGWRLDERAC